MNKKHISLIAACIFVTTCTFASNRERARQHGFYANPLPNCIEAFFNHNTKSLQLIAGSPCLFNNPEHAEALSAKIPIGKCVSKRECYHTFPRDTCLDGAQPLSELVEVVRAVNVCLQLAKAGRMDFTLIGEDEFNIHSREETQLSQINANRFWQVVTEVRRTPPTTTEDPECGTLIAAERLQYRMLFSRDERKEEKAALATLSSVDFDKYLGERFP